MKYILLIMTVFTLALTACVKEHPDRNDQGFQAEVKAGRAISLKSLDGFYVVNTNSTGQVSATSVDRPVLSNYFDYGGNYVAQTMGQPEPAGMSLANEVIISEDVQLIHHLNKIKFTTDAPLLKNFVETVDFLGEPNKTYKLKYKITPNRLLVMKLVNEKEISHYELPYSDNLGNGMYAVPLGGYAISAQKKEKILNNDNEATNRYRLVSADMQFKEDGSLKFGCSNCADYIRIDPESFKIFIRIKDKKDVYPAEYFEGEWYFSESVVDSKPGSETSIGQIFGAFDLNFKPASRVKFFRTSKTLQGYNVAIDEELDKDDTKNLTPVISFPAEGKNYQVNETGLSAQLQEVVIDDTSLERAPYIDIDFEKISTLRTRLERMENNPFTNNDDEEDEIPLVAFGDTAGALKQVKFEKDSFSFTLENVTTGHLWKYSFLRAGQRNYQPRRHYKTDREQYGYFFTYKTRIARPESDFREEDFERNVLLQRHNPNKDIVFYFSNLTPKDNNGKCRQPGDLNLGDVVVGQDEINFRELGRRAIQYWDAAFKAAGASNRVVLKEVDEKGKCFDAPLGDLKYNSINLIDSIQSSNLLGVGPSLVDPHTGEVVNTTTNVHIAPFRQILSSEIRIFIQSRLGTYSDLSNRLDPQIVGNSTVLGDVLDSAMSPFAQLANVLPKHLKKFVASQYHFGAFLEDLDESNLPRKATLNGYGPLDPVNLFSAGEFNPNTKAMKLLQLVSDHLMVNENVIASDRVQIGPVQNYKDAYDRALLVQKYRPTFFRMYLSAETSSLATMNNITEDIIAKCPSVMSFIDQKLASAGNSVPRVTSAEEAPVIKKCMARLIPEKMLATIVHEIGHNLGLRHNFFGSTDKKNFFTKQEVKDIYNVDIANTNELPQSSSVMDYVPSDKDRLAYPGHYDIAAIRYGYANAIELESGGPALSGPVVELNDGAATNTLGETGSIDANIADNNWNMRKFKYCTDEHASMDIDPMCQRHDYGTTPQESVDDIINQFYESLVITGNRYDRYVAASNAPFSRNYRVQRLKRFYNEWRFKLADYLGTNKQYLENYSPQDYQALLNQLANDPNFKGKDYLEVRNKIFKFFKDVILLKNKYCLSIDPQLQQVKAVELEKIRTQIRHKFPNASIPNCEDPAGIVKNYIESDKSQGGLGLKYIGDIGFSLNNYKYLVDAREAVNEPIDVIGTFVDRILTMTNLVSRDAGTPGFLQKFNPNMLDEPDLFFDFEQMVLSRILNGVDMSDQLQKDDIQTSLKNLGFEDLLPPASQKNQALYTSNFEEERPVLLTLWSMLEQGATNPYVNSAARTTRYGRFIESGSPDLIEQVQSEGGRVLPLDSGEVLVVRKENTISLALVNKFYEVVNRLNQGYQPVPKEAELKKHLNDGLLPLIAGLPADSSQMTAEDYVAFADSVFKFVQGTENPYVMNLVQQLMMPELGPYLLVFQQVTSQIEAGLANGEDVSELQDQLNQIMGQVNSMGLAAFFKQVEPSLQQALGMPDFKTRLPDQKLTAESITQQMDQTVAFVVEMARLAKLDFESNFDEYVAQATLLRSVLVFDSGLSEYVGQILELVALNNNSDLALERMKNLDPAAYQGLLSPEAYVNQVVNTPEFSKLRMQAVQRNLSAQRR